MIVLVDLGGSYVVGMIWIYNNIGCVLCGVFNEFLSVFGYVVVIIFVGVLGLLVDGVFFFEG